MIKANISNIFSVALPLIVGVFLETSSFFSTGFGSFIHTKNRLAPVSKNGLENFFLPLLTW